MTDPLTEAGNLCQQTLQVLVNLKNLPNENIKVLSKRLKDLLGLIAESKKKIMVRAPQGQKLSAEILNDASRLNEIANLTSIVNEETMVVAEKRLVQLEDSVKKLEIYWKSFEYAIT